MDVIFGLKDGKWTTDLLLTLTEGRIDDWKLLTYHFIDTVRKQFLMWRGLKPEEKTRYDQ